MTDQPRLSNARPGDPEAPSGAEPPAEPVGPARDFAAFCELERERRRNSDDDFDPDLFDQAVALVLAKLRGPEA